MRAETAVSNSGAPGATALFFSGFDLWRAGNFSHGGVYWSPDGLDRDGLVFKAMLFGGAYRYTSGALGDAEVRGRQLGAQILPGWRFTQHNLEVKVFTGLEWQDHRLSPDDPSAGLRGHAIALRTVVEAWYQPSTTTMLTGHAAVSSINRMHDARAAFGWRVFDRLYLGPEIAEFSAANYRQYRFGIHATAFRTGDWEWSAAIGYARDSDRVSGAYGRAGVLTRR